MPSRRDTPLAAVSLQRRLPGHHSLLVSRLFVRHFRATGANTAAESQAQCMFTGACRMLNSTSRPIALTARTGSEYVGTPAASKSARG